MIQQVTRGIKITVKTQYEGTFLKDFALNYEIVKRIRKFKVSLEDIESKRQDAEEIQNEVVRTLTEKDIDNSADILGGKAMDLRERLDESKG